MLRQILRRPALAFVLGGLVVGAAFAGTAAYAKLTAPTANTITACYKSNGEVTLIGLETKRNECKKNELEVTWNIVGPRGATGAKGDKGDTGATGATGAPGAKGDKGDPGTDGVDGLPGAEGPIGPQGPAGATGGTASLSSSNGRFKIEVENDGIFIRGPSGTTFVDLNGPGSTSDPYYGK